MRKPVATWACVSQLFVSVIKCLMQAACKERLTWPTVMEVHSHGAPCCVLERTPRRKRMAEQSVCQGSWATAQAGKLLSGQSPCETSWGHGNGLRKVPPPAQAQAQLLTIEGSGPAGKASARGSALRALPSALRASPSVGLGVNVWSLWPGGLVSQGVI